MSRSMAADSLANPGSLCRFKVCGKSLVFSIQKGSKPRFSIKKYMLVSFDFSFNFFRVWQTSGPKAQVGQSPTR